MSRRKQLRPQHLQSGDTPEHPEGIATITSSHTPPAVVDGLNEGASHSTSQQPYTQPYTTTPPQLHIYDKQPAVSEEPLTQNDLLLRGLGGQDQPVVSSGSDINIIPQTGRLKPKNVIANQRQDHKGEPHEYVAGDNTSCHRNNNTSSVVPPAVDIVGSSRGRDSVVNQDVHLPPAKPTHNYNSSFPTKHHTLHRHNKDKDGDSNSSHYSRRRHHHNRSFRPQHCTSSSSTTTSYLCDTNSTDDNTNYHGNHAKGARREEQLPPRQQQEGNGGSGDEEEGDKNYDSAVLLSSSVLLTDQRDQRQNRLAFGTTKNHSKPKEELTGNDNNNKPKNSTVDQSDCRRDDSSRSPQLSPSQQPPAAVSSPAEAAPTAATTTTTPHDSSDHHCHNDSINRWPDAVTPTQQQQHSPKTSRNNNPYHHLHHHHHHCYKNTSNIQNPADQQQQQQPSSSAQQQQLPTDCLPTGDVNDRRYLSAKLFEKKHEIIKRIRRHSALAATSVSGASDDNNPQLVIGSRGTVGGRRTRTYSERGSKESVGGGQYPNLNHHQHQQQLLLAAAAAVNQGETFGSSSGTGYLQSGTSLSINTGGGSGGGGLLYASQPLTSSPLGGTAVGYNPWVVQQQQQQPIATTPTLLQTPSPGSDIGGSGGVGNVLPRYTCQVCGVVLRSLPELGMHIQEHAAERLYKCELCDKSFEKRSDLEKHQVSDHRLQPTLASHNDPSKSGGDRSSGGTGDSVSAEGRPPTDGDKNRFNFHSPWEEFDSRREVGARVGGKKGAAPPQDRRHWNGDSHPGMDSATAHIKTEQLQQQQQHHNTNNNGRPGTTTTTGSKPGDLDLSYRSTGGVPSLDSSLSSSDRLNSSGDTASYHSALQSPGGEEAAVAMAITSSGSGVREPGETTGLSGPLKRELTAASFGAEQAATTKAYNGIVTTSSSTAADKHHALDGLKSLAAKSFAYPPSLPGFTNAFRHPSGPWLAMSKYGAQQVNGYMPGIVASPGVVSPGYSDQTSGVATTTSSSRNNSGSNNNTSSGGGGGAVTVSFRGTLGKQTDTGLACSYCGKVCPRPSILKRHMMMHTGERPFECKVCGQRFRAKGSMLFHQKLRHNMDVKLNKALEERYLQIVANQRQKQMREERKKAALTSKDSTAWFQHEMQSWMLQNHLQGRVAVGTGSSGVVMEESSGSVRSQADKSAAVTAPEVTETMRNEGSPRGEGSRLEVAMEYLGTSLASNIDAADGSPCLAIGLVDRTSSSIAGKRRSSDNSDGIVLESDDGDVLSSKLAAVSSPPLAGTTGVLRIKSERRESYSPTPPDNTTISSQPRVRTADVNGNLETVPVVEGSSDFKEARVHKDETSSQDGSSQPTTVLPEGEGFTVDGREAPAEEVDEKSQMMELSTESVNRLRDMMFTPDSLESDHRLLLQQQQPHQVVGFDDNCNLKENLDKLIMKAFGKLGLDTGYGNNTSHPQHHNHHQDGESESPVPTDGNGQEGGGGGRSQNTSRGESLASSTSASPQGSSGGAVGGGRSATDDLPTIDYPSVFPGLKHRMKVHNETVIVTRLDGVRVSGGGDEPVSLYKCYLCGRIFRQLSLLQCHLSTHFERQVTFYECLYCDAHFKFKTQLLRHMKLSHDVSYALGETRVPEMGREAGGEAEEEESLDDGGHGGSHWGTTEEEEGRRTFDLSALHDEPDNEEAKGGESRGQLEGNYIEDFMGMVPTSDATMTTTPLSHKGKHNSGIVLKRVDGLYACRLCGKTFERSFSLLRHERMHTGHKPCVCRHCGRGFSEPRNLRQHTARFHGNQATSSLRGLKHHRLIAGRHAEETLTKASSHPKGHGSTPYAHLNTQEEHGENKSVMETDDVPDKQGIVASTVAAGERREEEQVESPHDGSGSMEGSRLDSREMAADEIREKERLGDDITVVIPSEPPQERSNQDNTTPRSSLNSSENTTWSNISEVDAEQQGAEIIAAPVRSLIGTHQFKPKRRPSYPGGGGGGLRGNGGPESPPFAGLPQHQPTPLSASSPHEIVTSETRLSLSSGRSPALALGEGSPFGEAEVKSTIVITPDTPSTNAAMAQATTSCYGSTPQGAAPAGMSPFGPLSVSTFLNPAGLPGLIPSPLMSPAQQALFFSQTAGLTSPTVMGGVLPFVAPYHTTSSSAASTSTPGGLGGASSSGKESVTGGGCESYPGVSVKKMEEMSRADYLNQMKGSSLSRTHSRNPIKREEACKPTVLTDGRTVYRCSYCNKDFATYSDINRHMDFHEDIRPYKCKYCDYYARTNSQLKVHMMRHQGIREFHCKLCNYKGVTQSDLNRHMKSQIHMMKAQNECRQCGEGFVSHKNLERHMEEKHLAKVGAGSPRASIAHASSDPVAAAMSIAGFQAPLPR